MIWDGDSWGTNYTCPLFVVGVGENGAKVARTEATTVEQLKISILVSLMITGL